MLIFSGVAGGIDPGMEIGEVIEDLTMMVDSNNENEEDVANKVQLMTMHASKGLEFDNVYAIGMDNITTHGPEPDEDEVEESRRLTYVAATRAKKKLSLSYSCGRVHNGQYINVTGSPFFDEIEERIGVKRFSMAEFKRQREAASGMSVG